MLSYWLRRGSGYACEKNGSSTWGDFRFQKTMSNESLEKYSAGQLFLGLFKAGRITHLMLMMPSTSLSRICRLVEGIPLAIELASKLDTEPCPVMQSPVRLSKISIFSAPISATSQKNTAVCVPSFLILGHC